MNIILLIFKIPLVIQTIENSEFNIATDFSENIEYFTSIITVLIATIVMMLIPVILFYLLIISITSIYNYNKIEMDFWCYENNPKSKYIKAHASFYKYLSALSAWNIFSLIYIVFSFENFSIGLNEYFNFPFEIFQLIKNEDVFNSISLFKSNWVAMITITLFTLSFYILGKYIGILIAKNKIKKKRIVFLNN